MTEEKSEAHLAEKILQFLYLGDGGFRFPLAYFPVKSVPDVILYEHFWKGVLMFEAYGFNCYYCILDGADTNRNFVNLYFQDGNGRAHKFTTNNLHNGTKMIFIMNPKHYIKKN